MRRSAAQWTRALLALVALSIAPRTATAGLVATVWPTEVRQGEVVVVQVSIPDSPETLRGTFAGRPLLFAPLADGAYRALVGIDLGHSPGTYPVTLHWRHQETDVTHEVPVAVRDAAFPIQRLTLPPRMVDPDPADLPRIQEEQELLEALFAQADRIPHFAEPFVLPIDQAFQPTGTFGRRRILNGRLRSPHTGEDFSAPAGTPVHASNRGQVAYTGVLYFAGRCVILDHGLGLYTLYFHLDSIAVDPGEMVERGRLLGSVGATGRATGPHLHWGARLGPARVDPMALLRLGDGPPRP
ncbi:MAG: M23 family metallopeptidase [candidate division NC10 bacterium]|nr:M23 family metallopeptidase [candidate division NC10 bacterium]